MASPEGARQRLDTVCMSSADGNCSSDQRWNTGACRDVTHLSVLLDDAIDSGQGDLAEALRPLYLDYLEKHGVGETE